MDFERTKGSPQAQKRKKLQIFNKSKKARIQRKPKLLSDDEVSTETDAEDLEQLENDESSEEVSSFSGTESVTSVEV